MEADRVEMKRRNLRPRYAGQYVSQQEWEMEGQAEDDIILGQRYNVLDKFYNTKYQADHGFVKEMDGEDFNLKYVQENGFIHSLVFHNPANLGMRMPSSELTVVDIKKLVGSRRKVDVIDTLTQDSITMTLGQWSKYYQKFPRQRLLNIISLEISCTKLDPMVKAPDMVRQLDWVEQVWPLELKEKQTNPTNDLNKMMYPKVQKYCLMSVAGCYTDFHLDFGGTSVWYHVLKGEKRFLLIPPSQSSYSQFQKWQKSGDQEGIFLAELVEKAQLVRLCAGDTFMMPSGWIHAVYTPSDSIVFGGNFLHSFNIAQQLMVSEVEQSTKVPLRQRYPFYGSIHWYVLSKYAQELRRFIVRKKRERSTSTEESDCQNSSQHWLKEVAVKKCALFPSPGSKCDEEGDMTIVMTTSEADSPLGYTPESSTPISLENFEAAAIALPPGETYDVDFSLQSQPYSPTFPKPHFSNHERGGLLLLVQKMKQHLFQPDVPISITSSDKLLKDIDELLQSAMSEKTSSLEPSGVGILAGRKESFKRHTRKRIRKQCVENPKMTKSKFLKMSHVNTSNNTCTDSFETKHETTNDQEMEDCSPDPPESVTSSSSNSSPSIFTKVADSVMPNFQSPMPKFFTPEVVLAICDNEVQIDSEQSSLVVAPLHCEESIITKLPNPAFINS